MFLHKSVILSTGVCGEGVRFLACTTGHMTGGVCIQGQGFCIQGGLHPGGRGWVCIQWGGGSPSNWVRPGVCLQGGWRVFIQGVCIWGGGGDKPPGSAYRGRPPPPRYMGYYDRQSTSRWYASYWNAFL